MHDAESVHVVELDYERDGRELRLNPAVVETDRGIVLVDTGLPGSVGQVREALDAAGLSLSAVEFVLLTHQDGDHVGGCAELLAETDATVLAHREATPYVAGDRPPIKGDPEDRPTPVGVDLELVDGVRLRTEDGPMEVVHTPGHSPGHVSLFFPETGLLVAGDALTAAAGELAGPKPEFTPDLETATESVGRLAGLEVESVLCYHGGWVAADADRIRTLHAELSGT